MTQWRFEIFNRIDLPDVKGQEVLESIKELGIRSVDRVKSERVFLIDGDFNKEFAIKIAEELLTDPVSEQFYIGRQKVSDIKGKTTLIEVHLKSGVTDPVADSVTMAIEDMGKKADHVRTAKKYVLFGDVDQQQTDTIIKKILANDCIEDVIVGDNAEPPSPHLEPYKMDVIIWPICELNDDELIQLSKDKDLFLDLKEMKTIQNYFRKLRREPIDIELETLAQTWSEHCVHKTLKSEVDMDLEGENIHFDNLLKDTVFGATKKLDKDWCISVFSDNAGVVEFDEDTAVCFKVETHNHPSALDPYGGAATGIGGVIRDPMGTGLGSKPIANTDIFCFGEPDKNLDEVPKGVLHPRRIMKGVVSGVRDYGNRMGIPTVNGAIYFDDRYIANPLVFCGNLGVMDKDKCFKDPKPGNYVVVVGGKTGRDGIHGATFSSGEMTHEHETIFSHAVQIGNPITEKKMLDVLLQANEKDLYEAITDCGAGGLSSAVGEMGEKLGVEVDLDKVPLKYAGLSYTEIWISEAQERMVLSVKPENIDELLKLFDSENVQATVIGKFKDDKKLTLRYEGEQVCDMDMEFLHDGVPKYSRKAAWKMPNVTEPGLAERESYNADLLKIMSSYNVASKEWVIRQYDHEVQGCSVIKPLAGIQNDGPSDAAVVKVKYNSGKGIALACGMNPLYGDIDPYQMALSGIDEAIRNLICVGARVDRIALLDNFCWGNCTRPETLGSLVRAAQACHDGAMAYEAPFISGKDSLNNEFVCDDGTQIIIPSTLLISAMSLVDNVNHCITMDIKKEGSLVFVIGETKNELGGSHYYKVNGQMGANVPELDLELAPRTSAKVSEVIKKGLVKSCHDCSEGGLAAALAEMAFSGGFGIEADLSKLAVSKDCSKSFMKLFSESNSRYIVEVTPEDKEQFINEMAYIPHAEIGKVTKETKLKIKDNDSVIVDIENEELKEAWKKPLDW